MGGCDYVTLGVFTHVPTSLCHASLPHPFLLQTEEKRRHLHQVFNTVAQIVVSKLRKAALTKQR